MSARIFVLSGKALGSDHGVDQATTLGRGKDAGVRLHDPSVSRIHARIEPEGDGWRLTDLDSSNGIWIGGKRVPTVLLKDLDEFRVGALELRIRVDASSPANPSPAPPSAAPVVPDPGPTPPALDPKPTKKVAHGIELEGGWSEPVPPSNPLVDLSASTPAPQPAQRSASASPKPRVQDPHRPVLQQLGADRSGGLLSGDLGQQSFVVRWSLYLLAVGLFVGLAWGVKHLVFGVRKARSSPPLESFE